MDNIIAMTYRDNPVSFDTGNRMINVTELFKASGAPEHKRPSKWIVQEQAQELLTILSEDSLDTIVTREGRHGGTWYPEELALAYSMYLSPHIHLACLRFLLSHMRGQATSAGSLTRADVEALIDARIAARGGVLREKPGPKPGTIKREKRIYRYNCEPCAPRPINGELPPYDPPPAHLRGQQRTLKALRALGGRATLLQIRQYTGQIHTTELKTLGRLMDRGCVQKVDYGVYELMVKLELVS